MKLIVSYNNFRRAIEVEEGIPLDQVTNFDEVLEDIKVILIYFKIYFLTNKVQLWFINFLTYLSIGFDGENG